MPALNVMSRSVLQAMGEIFQEEKKCPGQSPSCQAADNQFKKSISGGALHVFACFNKDAVNGGSKLSLLHKNLI